MTVAPLQLPGPLIVPQLDFSPLDKIGDAYVKNQERQREAAAFGGLVESIPTRGEPTTPTVPTAVPGAARSSTPSYQRIPGYEPSTASAGPPGGQLPRGLRNNNPGNIEDGALAKSLPGYAGSDGRFAKFDTPENGLGAMDALLTSYGRRGLKTVGEVIGRWAPSSDNNDVGAYARFVSPNGDPNASVDLSDPQQRREMIGKMSMFENGMHGGPPGGNGAVANAPQPSQAEMATAAQGMTPDMKKRVQALFAVGSPTATAAGISLISRFIGKQEPIKLGEGDVLVDPQTGKVIGRAPEKAYAVRPGGALVRGGQAEYESPKQLAPVVTGTDVLGHPSRGTFNPATGEYRDVQGRPIGQSGAAPGQAGGDLHGEEFLKTQDPGIRDDIKAMAEGRLPSAGFGAQKNLLPLVAQYDPNFDATQYPTMLATRKNYTSGKQFQEIQAINTVAGHLGNIMRSADDLNNTRFPWWNTVANSALQATGDPRVDKFNTDKQAVTNEMSKAYRGGHVTEGDVKEWQSNISAAKSPEQLKAVIGEFNDLLMSKRQALEDGYRSSMGAAPLPKEFTAESAHARKAFNSVAAWSHGVKPESGPTPGQPAATGTNIPDAAVKDLRANPSPARQKQFDDIFGAGAAKRAMGPSA